MARMKKLATENPDNLKKMVIISELTAKKTSKLLLNSNALRFKNNIAEDI